MSSDKPIRVAQKKSLGKAVSQLVFSGEDCTKEAVLKLRDERVE